MGDKKRILFVNDEMTMGGVARVLNTLMGALPVDQYEVDCLVLHKRGELLDEIPSQVTVFEGTSFFEAVDWPLKELVKQKKWRLLIKKMILVFYMKTGLIEKKVAKERKKIGTKQYDIEVAAKEGFCTIFTAYGDSKKKINWVLTDYRVCNYSKRHMKLMKRALEHIDLNVADSQAALTAYEELFGVSGGVAIHNLMDVNKVRTGMKETWQKDFDMNMVNVIAIARFHFQKRIDRLLLAHQSAIAAGLDHHLYLVGSGEEEGKLRAMVKEKKLDQVTFLGLMKNPYGLLAQCDLFVLSSEYEGFATIVNESLIAATPVLATKVSGISEQLIDKSHGWIVGNNQEDLSNGYIDAIKDSKQLKEMKKQLQSYEYPNDKILKQFEAIF